MTVREFGSASSNTVLIQMVDDHDLEVIENEVRYIRENTADEFRLLAVKVNAWNTDLSPWNAPAVFGNEDFGSGAADTLEEVKKLCSDRSKSYYIGGYSLAGLFALWAAYQTDLFKGVATASPSVWFPDFSEYMKEHEIHTKVVYLSLGDKESKARNTVMSRVADRIRDAYNWLKDHDVNCTLEWNPGNHFRDPDIRTAKAFAWVTNQKKTS